MKHQITENEENIFFVKQLPGVGSYLKCWRMGHYIYWLTSSIQVLCY